MSTIADKTHHIESHSFHVIILLSAWGFAVAIASFLFLWLGYLLDELWGTAPIFMVALFFLGLIGCFIELYQEALKMMKDA